MVAGKASFEDLEVWKRGCKLAVLIYESLRESRDFALRDQMQRAAVSIPSNIAEGSERTPKDFARFLRIAIGSAAELRTQAYIAGKIGMLEDATRKTITDETKELARMMQALINSITS